jgi:hypothetical protein
MRDHYRYQIELVRPDGSVAGQETIAPDWEPAIEWSRLAGLRTHGVWATAQSAEQLVEPIWNQDAGEPHVAGVRLHLGQSVHDSRATEFPASYFAAAAAALQTRLTKDGSLSVNEPIEFRTSAFPALEHAPSPLSHFSSIEIEPPLPLGPAELSLATAHAEQRGEPNVDDLEVLIAPTLLAEAEAVTLDAGACETGGILIGRLHRDITLGDIFIEVTAQIPARHTQSDSVTLTFTTDTWTHARAALA